jgi:glycosyltransferase involved in cell wall biosynthesis
LEDNEETIFEKRVNMSKEQIQGLSEDQLNRIVTKGVSHPIHYKSFLKEADGITVIIEKLREFISKGKPNMVLWPIIDPVKFAPGQKDPALLHKLGMNSDAILICYTGNVHASNAREIRSLYLAVAMANEEGLPVKLIRTGVDHCDFLGDDSERAHKNSVELGYVKYEEIPGLLALADILIQPGGPDEFNDYRLPSKIPEFLAAGKPVVAPNTNIGRYLRNGRNAMITKKGDEFELLGIIKLLSKNRALRERLSKGGREFAVKNFAKKRISSELERFYRHVSGSRPVPLDRSL